jgi:hypothetical protein
MLALTVHAEPPAVLVEAEAFKDAGGWVNDSQFMDQMGSPFLLAHGLGRPVEDAETTVQIPSPGKYRVWVRTRDWVAQWTEGRVDAPGKFQVLINDNPLETVFGTEGVDWHWQDGGVVQVDKKETSLKLHDLTGFEGRCDAVLLSSDLHYTPPDDAPAPWRRKLLGLPEAPVLKGNYELVVVGGGIAGITTCLSAARLGVKVALIHNRPVTGGASSPESGVGLTGQYCLEPYPNLGLLTHEISWSYGTKKRRALANATEAAAYQMKALEEAGVALFINFHADEVFMEDGRIRGVAATSIVDSSRIRVNGKWFVDATGDGCIGYMARADYDISGLHMGRTNLWSIEDTGEPTQFPRCPWAIDLTEKPFPGRTGEYESALPFTGLWGWYWESGFNHDPFEMGEHIRDNNFRAMYGAWDCLKNVDRRYPTHKIRFAYWISGKRESRRLFGDVILTRQDLISSKQYKDGCVPLTWRIDVHIPNPWFTDRRKPGEGYTEDPFIAWAQPGDHSHYPTPYWMPYRCLYSRNVPNLFMAGRDISVTHEALGAVRVQTTTGMMGEVIGMAAMLCVKHGVDPRGVYEHHMEELFALMDEGTGKRLPVKTLAYEPFDFTGKLNGSGSGSGWAGKWAAKTGKGASTTNKSLRYPGGTDLSAVGGSLLERTGGVASQRLLAEPVGLGGGYFYMSFLAQKDESGRFRIETSNGQHIRLGLEVTADGAVTAQGATVRTSTTLGLFKANTPYLVVLKFSNAGGKTGAVARVKLFEVGKEKVPARQRGLQWDVVTAGGQTGVLQDRIILSVSQGDVMMDELRLGSSWESVTTQTEQNE